MKKMLIGILTFLLVGNYCCTLAEIPDIEGLSIDELHILQQEIYRELGERKELPSFNAPIGVYEAGKDFPVGKYLITSPNYCTYITLYSSMDDYKNGKKLEKQRTIYNGYEGKWSILLKAW